MSILGLRQCRHCGEPIARWRTEKGYPDCDDCEALYDPNENFDPESADEDGALAPHGALDD